MYKTEEEEVMVLQERVSEAQRVAKMVRLNWEIFPLMKMTCIDMSLKLISDTLLNILTE